jgi:hypothetical protein
VIELDPLAAAPAARLERDGYVVFPGLLPAVVAAALAARVDELAAAEGDRAGAEQHQEPGCLRVADLVNKDPLFDVCWTHPLLLSAAACVLGGRPFKLSALAARDPLRGGGQQGLHADWPRPVPANDAQVCNAAWMLDAFEADNGATRVVPGSHRLADRLPWQDLADLDAPHPRETMLVGPPGTLAVFSAHLWHSGTRNASGARRRSIFAYFVRRDQPTLVDQGPLLRAETAARLTTAQRWLLGV